MPSNQIKDGKFQELTALAERYGIMLADQAYGPEGPGLDVDLATMEDLAVALQQSLLKGMCEQLTQRQSSRLPGIQPCPECGGACEVEQSEQVDLPVNKSVSRPIRTRGGPFDLTEPRCYCRSCRRSFFPSADSAQD